MSCEYFIGRTRHQTESVLIMNEIRNNVTLYKSFRLLLAFKASAIGANHRLKETLVNMAFFSIFILPLVIYLNYITYSGKQPPEVALIQTTGVFVHVVDLNGLKKTSYTLFKSDDGAVYRSDENIVPQILHELGEQSPPQKVYSEGFLLRNGKGSYYPLKITTLQGVNLVDPQVLSELLDRESHPFSFRNGIFLFVSYFILFMFTLCFSIQLRNNLNKEV